MHNPSTCRLLSVTVKEVTDTEAQLRTAEYWYLRWWSIPNEGYTYPYRETNRQIWFLRPDPKGIWRVWDNLYPPPRMTVPHRKHRKPRDE